MDDRDPFSTLRFPSAARPLLGLTVLLVEDSRFASEAMRLLCMRSGARIRRADCLRSARRHLQVYRPSVLIVDMGLPDGLGSELIAEAHETLPRIAVIMGISADDSARESCLAAGADGFLAKPLQSVAYFQTELLRHLPPDRQPTGPLLLHDETVKPDTVAYRDDMAHVVELLEAGEDQQMLDYVTQFLEGVAGLAGDHALRDASSALRKARQGGHPLRSDLAHLAGLLQERLSNRVAI